MSEKRGSPFTAVCSAFIFAAVTLALSSIVLALATALVRIIQGWAGIVN